MRPDPASIVREGDVLAGKYRVEKVLGVGGMGVVVAAHHIALDSKVAIKFLLPEMLNNREAVARFASEARSAVRIKSEYVARVFDVGTLDTGAPYIVMEFLDGGDLATWLEQRGRLPLEQAVEFVLEVCLAVADAHGLGIVHRDLKPANFFCTRRSDGKLSIKVLDFGISKVTGSDAGGNGMSVTRTNSVMGSPLYMSPEQLRSPREVDAQTDIWAIGASLYELLTGKVPFHAESVAELAVKLATESPPSLRGLRPEVPAGLEAVVLRCLERDRARRYQNVAQLAVALLDFAPKGSRVQVERISAIIRATGLADTEMGVPPSRQSADAGRGTGTGTIPPIGRTDSGTRRTRALTGIAGLTAGLAVTIGIGSLALRGRPREGHAPSPDPASATAPIQASLPPPGGSIPTPGALPSRPPPADPVLPAAPAEPTAAAEPPAPRAAPRPPPRHESQAHAPSSPPKPPASATASAAPPAASRTTTSCTPPFYFDEKGARVFKKECLQ